MLTSVFQKKFQTYCSHLHLNSFRVGVCMSQWTESASDTFLHPSPPRSSIGCDSADHQCQLLLSLLGFLPDSGIIDIFCLLLLIPKQSVNQMNFQIKKKILNYLFDNITPNFQSSSINTQIFILLFLSIILNYSHPCRYSYHSFSAKVGYLRSLLNFPLKLVQ